MNGDIVGSLVGVIGLLWCEIVCGLLFTLEMTGRVGVVSLFGAGLRIVCSHSVGMCCV